MNADYDDYDEEYRRELDVLDDVLEDGDIEDPAVMRARIDADKIARELEGKTPEQLAAEWDVMIRELLQERSDERSGRGRGR